MPSKVQKSILRYVIVRVVRHVIVRVKEDVRNHYEHQWEKNTELVDQTLSRICERRVPIQHHIQNVRQATQISVQASNGNQKHDTQNRSHLTYIIMAKST